MHRARLSMMFALVASFSFAAESLAQAKPNVAVQGIEQVTVPLIITGNRPFVDVTFRKADGSKRIARLLLDTGGGGFIIIESLATELGLKWGAVRREEASEYASATVLPSAFIGDFPLQLNPDRVTIAINRKNFLPQVAPGFAEGMIPGHVLAQYHVVFDYPAATFTIARPGVLVPRGQPMPMRVSRFGFPRTEIVVDGKTNGMLLDTGASFTMVSEVRLNAWGASHQEWSRHKGAVGDAVTLGGMAIETMFVPTAQWGTNKLEPLGVVSQREGTFETYMSRMMAAPIVGSLAGNILKSFRVELDYRNEKLYLSRP